MAEQQRRAALKSEYRDTPRSAGVYRIVSAPGGRGVLGTSTNLRSIENRVAFAKSTKSLGALDARLKPAIEADGFDSLAFEVLEEFVPAATATPAAVRDELATLEKLWREKLGPAALL